MLNGFISDPICLRRNIGPTPEGTFPLQDQVRLHDLGEWMEVNGEAIYNTKGSPFRKEHVWGSLSQSKENNFIYLHLWNWTGGSIKVNGLKSQVKKAILLDTGERLSVNQDNNSIGLIVELPEKNDAKILRIVKLETEGKEFIIEKGPDFEAPKDQHVTHKKITGTITRGDGVNFSISGKHVISSKTGFEIYDDQEETIQFTLNDHVRLRLNKNGNISAVQNINLLEGSKYHVVYSPYQDGWEVEIVTKLE